MQQYTTIYNSIQQYTTTYNNIQQYTTIYNNIHQYTITLCFITYIKSALKVTSIAALYGPSCRTFRADINSEHAERRHRDLTHINFVLYEKHCIHVEQPYYDWIIHHAEPPLPDRAVTGSKSTRDHLFMFK